MVSMHFKTIAMLVIARVITFVTQHSDGDKTLVKELQINCFSNTFTKFYHRQTDLVVQ